jgi:hypothetical protein
MTIVTPIPQIAGPHGARNDRRQPQPLVSFQRQELTQILSVYGRMVAAGEWKDYAIDAGRETAVFSVYRRATEYPLFRIEKRPKLTNRQGAYAVLGPGGQILKRGRDLSQVLRVFDKKRLEVVGR